MEVNLKEKTLLIIMYLIGKNDGRWRVEFQGLLIHLKFDLPQVQFEC